MKIIYFTVFLIKITKEANSLRCHVNYGGENEAEPKNETCNAPWDEWCRHKKTTYEVWHTIRQCWGKMNFVAEEIKEGCLIKPEYIQTKNLYIHNSTTICYCKSDNCNYNCTAGDTCTEHVYKEKHGELEMDTKYYQCDGECNPPATEKYNATTVEDKNEDSQATEAASEDGKGEDSKATEEFKITTGEPESGTGGCQRITNSFEIFFLFWILASLVYGSEKLRRM